MAFTQVTIKDIARELGISPSTVSRALKDHPDISQKTKDAVNELATRLNYRPNALALSLRSKKSNTIGLIIPEIAHDFFSSVISGIEEVAYKSGYNVMICQSNESYSREMSNVHAMISSRVAGVIVSISKETDDFQHFQAFQDAGMPVVFFDRVVPDFEADCVLVDDEAGAYAAVKHLAEQGCVRIAHLKGPENLLISQNRMNGYVKALRDSGLEFDPALVIPCDTFECAIEQTPALFGARPHPDGIFAVNDLTALGAMKAIRGMGLSVPADVAVVGFENSRMAALAEPSLSSVEQQGTQMGRQATLALLDWLKDENPERKPKVHTMKANLVLRDSSARGRR